MQLLFLLEGGEEEMRGGRLREAKKTIRALERTLKFRAPFNVLMDLDFAIKYTKTGMDASSLKSVFQKDVKLFITSCSYRRYKEAIPGNKRFIGEVCIKRCKHGEDLEEAECMRSFVEGGNKHHFFVAIGRDPRKQSLKNEKNVPLLYIQSGVVVLEGVGEETRTRMGERVRETREAGITKREKRTLDGMFPETQAEEAAQVSGRGGREEK